MRETPRPQLSAAAILITLLTACPPAPTEDAGLPITGTVRGSGQTTHTTIEADGGVLTAEGMTLSIEAGALPEGTEVTVTPLTVPGGENVITPVYRFEPAGLEFAMPVTVRFELPEGVPEGAVILWTKKDDPTQVEALETRAEGNTLLAQVTHFSSGYVHVTQNCGNGNIDNKVEVHCTAECGHWWARYCCSSVTYQWDEQCDNGGGNLPYSSTSRFCPRGQRSCGSFCTTSCYSYPHYTNVCGDGWVQSFEGERCDDSNSVDDVCLPNTSCNRCSATCGQLIITPSALEWTASLRSPSWTADLAGPAPCEQRLRFDDGTRDAEPRGQ